MELFDRKRSVRAESVLRHQRPLKLITSVERLDFGNEEFQSWKCGSGSTSIGKVPQSQTVR